MYSFSGKVWKVLTRPVKIKKICISWDPCRENLRFRLLSPKVFVIRSILRHVSYFHSFLFGTKGVPGKDD